MKRNGFTLVELLVVIAIITLLLAILLPSYATIIERVDCTLCQNNHHQIMMASVAYSAEHKAYLPFCNWLAPEKNGDWPGGGWLYYFSELIDYNGSRFLPADRKKGVLWNYIENDDVYRCPADAPPYKTKSTQVMTSYHMNGAVVAYYSGQVMRLFRTTDMISFAGSDAILFWEADDRLWNDGSSYPNEGLTRRHRDGATVGCVGGHTDWITHEEYKEEYEHWPSRLWCNPGSPSGRY